MNCALIQKSIGLFSKPSKRILFFIDVVPIPAFAFRNSLKRIELKELLNYNNTVFTFLPLDMWLTSDKPIVALS